MELDHFLSFEDRCLPMSPNRQMLSTASRLNRNNVLGLSSSVVSSLAPNNVLAHNGQSGGIPLSNSVGLNISASNENGLSPVHSTSNGIRMQHQLHAVNATSSGEAEGETLLHPFLDTSSSDTININSDNFEPWS